MKDTRVIAEFKWNLVPLAMIFLTLLSLNNLRNRLRGEEPPERIMRLPKNQALNRISHQLSSLNIRRWKPARNRDRDPRSGAGNPVPRPRILKV